MPDQFLFFEKYARFFDSLATLYDEMDRSYARVAAAYEFHCNGCAENCCLTRFYHHTLLELLYLRKGLAGLSESARKNILIRASAANKAVDGAEKAGKIPRVMCPLNVNGRCVLYAFRPMICRMHGIPHEFQHPMRGSVRGSGCHEFESLCGGQDYVPFDRTPFYRQMAELERGLREQTGFAEKIKKTVAQMLVEDGMLSEDVGKFL